MLLTTPVISTLKQNYPDAKIDVLLYQDTIPILSENPEINALYGIKNKKAKVTDKITNFLHLIGTLRANGYDLVVNLTDQWMVAILMRLLHIGNLLFGKIVLHVWPRLAVKMWWKATCLCWPR